MAKKKAEQKVITKVLFVWESNPKAVLAVFPEQPQGKTKSLVSGYSHLGQHTTVGIPYYKKLPQASRADYQSLYNELVAQGYELEVLNDMAKYAAATRKANSPKVSDCLIITYPDGTDNYYDKGENCKGWQEEPLSQIPIVIVYFMDNSRMRFVGHPYRIIEYNIE